MVVRLKLFPLVHNRNSHSYLSTLSVESVESQFYALTLSVIANFMYAFTDGTDAEGFTPLIMAAHFGHAMIVQVLLQYKANPNVSANDGCDALLCAVQGGHIDCIKHLIRQKANVDPSTDNKGAITPVYTAAQEGDAGIINILVKAKADVNRMVDGVPPLFISAQQGHTKCVHALIKAGADCNKKNSSNASPLFIAAQKGHASVCQVLLKENKIRVDDATETRTSPLQIAIQIGNLNETTMLLAAGAQMEWVDENGYTALLTAAVYGDMEIVETLVKAGADIQKKDNRGRTAQTILKEDFGYDLQKIVARHRPTSDVNALYKAHQRQHKKKKKGKKITLHDHVYNRAQQLFSKYDVNDDHTLCQEELRQCLIRLGCEQKLGKEKFEIFVSRCFNNSNRSSVDFEEFLRLYMQVMT